MVESLQVSERGSRLEKCHDIAIQVLRKAITEFNLLDLEESTEEIVNSTFEGMPNASNKQTINLSDPSLAASKGRPSNLQIKDSLELLNKGSPCCGYCKEKGHSKLKCPSFKHRRCDIINGQLSNYKVKASSMAD
ncbi:protein FAR1-RELATED SEQUENCE [Trifolium repens]|nr:protein FAR1-RELATED SEQUENCE [Trifolium repens]